MANKICRIISIREYLQHSPYAEKCGRIIESPLLTLNPVKRHLYQHKEYLPLVNACVLKLGKKRKILNQQFYNQYSRFLEALRYRPQLNSDDMISATYYYLLQDRIDDGFHRFKKIDKKSVSTVIQYDYLDAYLAFYAEEPLRAKAIAEKYSEYPVVRWQHRFREILSQAKSIDGEDVDVVDPKDRTQTQTELADTSPVLDFKIENNKLMIAYDNLARCVVNYYPMDVELLFSREPFVKEVSGRFSVIRLNGTRTFELPENKQSLSVSIPAEYLTSNTMIEIKGGGIAKTQTFYHTFHTLLNG